MRGEAYSRAVLPLSCPDTATGRDDGEGSGSSTGDSGGSSLGGQEKKDRGRAFSARAVIVVDATEANGQ